MKRPKRRSGFYGFVRFADYPTIRDYFPYEGEPLWSVLNHTWPQHCIRKCKRVARKFLKIDFSRWPETDHNERKYQEVLWLCRALGDIKCKKDSTC